MLRIVSCVSILLTSVACSTITEGTSQTLSIESDPAGAQCELKRDGMFIGKVVTPGSVLVQKTRKDISVTCHKDGYEDATVPLPYDMAASTLGNIILGGGIGLIVDAASNSSIKYASVTKVTMVSKSDQTAAAAAPAASEKPQAAMIGNAEIEAAVKSHFESNPGLYSAYIETNNPSTLKAWKVTVLRQEPGKQQQSWDVWARIEGVRTLELGRSGYPFRKVFFYRTERRDQKLAVVDWRLEDETTLAIRNQN